MKCFGTFAGVRNVTFCKPLNAQVQVFSVSVLIASLAFLGQNDELQKSRHK